MTVHKISFQRNQPAAFQRNQPAGGGHASTAAIPNFVTNGKGKTMTRDAKDLRVTLEAVRCTNSAGDPGTNLEIYGQLEARGVTLDEQGDPQVGFGKVLWSQSKDAGGINIAPNTEIPINSSVGFVVFERDFLWIGGKIFEEDTFSDDVLGDGFRKINYNSIANDTISVGFNKNDQEVLARYRIEMLRVIPHLEP